jgi:hypothetical protein
MKKTSTLLGKLSQSGSGKHRPRYVILACIKACAGCLPAVLDQVQASQTGP